MNLDRYRDRAERVVESAGVVGHHGAENLVVGIQEAIHEFVAHDMEWAALAVEAAIAAAVDRMGEVGRAGEVHSSPFTQDLVRVVASIRERGR